MSTKPNPYDRIYVTTVNATTFHFEDGFGEEHCDITAPNIGQAVKIFTAKFPQTADRYFDIDWSV